MYGIHGTIAFHSFALTMHARCRPNSLTHAHALLERAMWSQRGVEQQKIGPKVAGAYAFLWYALHAHVRVTAFPSQVTSS